MAVITCDLQSCIPVPVHFKQQNSIICATVLVPAAWLVLEDSVFLPSHDCQTGREVSCHTYGYPVRMAGSCPRVPVRVAGSSPRVETAKSHTVKNELL